jgi:hypothetical protein
VSDTPPNLPPASAPTPGTPASGSRRSLAIVAGAVVLVLIVVAVFAMTRPEDEVVAQTSPTTVATALGTLIDPGTIPPPTDPAEVPASEVTPNTHPLPPAPFQVATAKNRGNLAIFDAPNAIPATRSLPNPVLVNNDPNAAVPLVLLVRQKAAEPGWIEVFLPVRPNGSTGFVLESDVTLSSHEYHIEVTLSTFRLKAFKGDQVILDAPIAAASSNTPTPGGLYFTNMLIKPPDPNGPYGTYAYGLSGYSDTLQTFNGGPGQLGIHGTNDPSKMGQNVSHGCIRLRNQDIEKLAGVLPLGVPVQIFA